MDPTDEQAGAWTEAFDAGKFVRKSSEFRDHIGADGTFDVESGRYHLYVSSCMPVGPSYLDHKNAAWFGRTHHIRRCGLANESRWLMVV
jgi:hypothetical protein